MTDDTVLRNDAAEEKARLEDAYEEQRNSFARAMTEALRELAECVTTHAPDCSMRDK